MKGMLQITAFLWGFNILECHSEATQAQYNGSTKLKEEDVFFRVERLSSWRLQRQLERRELQGIKSPRLYVVCPLSCLQLRNSTRLGFQVILKEAK